MGDKTGLLDANGNKQWDKTYGGSGDDYLESMQKTSDGGYIISGSSGSGTSGDETEASKGGFDFWLLKTDANGNVLANKTIGGSADDFLAYAQQTADGGYIAGGTSSSDSGYDKSQRSLGRGDYWMIKLDAGGNRLWNKTFGGNNYETLEALQPTSDGGYIVGGSSISGIDSAGGKSGYLSGTDYWILKLDSTGNKKWDRSIGGGQDDFLRSLQQTTDGGYVLGGYTYSAAVCYDKTEAGRGSLDYWVVKTDTAGIKQWDKTIVEPAMTSCAL